MDSGPTVVRVLKITGNKITVVLSPLDEDADNVHNNFTNEFFVQMLRDALERHRHFWDNVTPPIDDTLNALREEIQPGATIDVNQFVSSSRFIKNGHTHLISILNSKIDGPKSLKKLCLDTIARSQVLTRRFQKIAGTIFPEWKKLFCCCCQKEFIELDPTTRRLDPGFVFRSAIISRKPLFGVVLNTNIYFPVEHYFDLDNLFEYILQKFPLPRNTDATELAVLASQADKYITLVTEKEMDDNLPHKLFQEKYKTECTKYKQKRDTIAGIQLPWDYDPEFSDRRRLDTIHFETGAHAIAASLINRACSAECAKKYAEKTPELELFNGSDMYFSHVEDIYEIEVTHEKYLQHIKVGMTWVVYFWNHDFDP